MYLPTDIIMIPHLEKSGDANIPLPQHSWHFSSGYAQTPLTDFSADRECFSMNLKQLLYYDNGMWRMFNVNVSDTGNVECSSQIMMPKDASPSSILSAKEVTRAEFDAMGFSVVNDRSYFEIFETTPKIIEWLQKRLVLVSMNDKKSFDQLIEPWKNATEMINTNAENKIEQEINREAISNLGTIGSRYIGKIGKSGPLHNREKKFKDHRTVSACSLPELHLVPNIDFVEPASSNLPGSTWSTKGGYLHKMAFVENMHIFLNYKPQIGFLSYTITEDWKYYYIDQDTKRFLLSNLLDSGYIKVCSDGDMERINAFLESESNVLHQSSEAFIRPSYSQVINNSSIKRW